MVDGRKATSCVTRLTSRQCLNGSQPSYLEPGRLPAHVVDVPVQPPLPVRACGVWGRGRRGHAMSSGFARGASVSCWLTSTGPGNASWGHLWRALRRRALIEPSHPPTRIAVAPPAPPILPSKRAPTCLGHCVVLGIIQRRAHVPIHRVVVAAAAGHGRVQSRALANPVRNQPIAAGGCRNTCGGRVSRLATVHRWHAA